MTRRLPKRIFGRRVWGAWQERCYPLVLAIVGFVLSIIFRNNLDISKLLFSASISLGSLFTGFSATCLSILIGSTSKVIQDIKKNNTYARDLYNYTRSPIVSGLVFSFLSILGLLFYKNCFVMNFLFPLWMANLIYCLSSGFRFGQTMFNIFSNKNY